MFLLRTPPCVLFVLPPLLILMLPAFGDSAIAMRASEVERPISDPNIEPETDPEPETSIVPPQLVKSTNLSGYAGFASLESWATGAAPGASGTGTLWSDSDLSHTIAARGNTFKQTGGDDGSLTVSQGEQPLNMGSMPRAKREERHEPTGQI